jgi:hypothetical protein
MPRVIVPVKSEGTARHHRQAERSVGKGGGTPLTTASSMKAPVRFAGDYGNTRAHQTIAPSASQGARSGLCPRSRIISANNTRLKRPPFGHPDLASRGDSPAVQRHLLEAAQLRHQRRRPSKPRKPFRSDPTPTCSTSTRNRSSEGITSSNILTNIGENRCSPRVCNSQTPRGKKNNDSKCPSGLTAVKAKGQNVHSTPLLPVGRNDEAVASGQEVLGGGTSIPTESSGSPVPSLSPRPSIATMQRDALKSSTIREYIAIIVGGASKEGLLSREDQASAARLLAAFERMAAHCVGHVKPLRDDGFLDEAIAGMAHQDVSDAVVFMRSKGLRVSDVARLCTHHVLAERGGISLTFTETKICSKSGKPSRERMHSTKTCGFRVRC